jgi:hypothetical protein
LRSREAARRDLTAAEEDLAEVRQRIGMVSNLLSPLIATVRDAQFAGAVAKRKYEAILEAAIDPLWQPRARSTSAHATAWNAYCASPWSPPDTRAGKTPRPPSTWCCTPPGSVSGSSVTRSRRT